jgi:hypothetical protein
MELSYAHVDHVDVDAGPIPMSMPMSGSTMVTGLAPEMGVTGMAAQCYTLQQVVPDGVTVLTPAPYLTPPPVRLVAEPSAVAAKRNDSGSIDDNSIVAHRDMARQELRMLLALTAMARSELAATRREHADSRKELAATRKELADSRAELAATRMELKSARIEAQQALIALQAAVLTRAKS